MRPSQHVGLPLASLTAVAAVTRAVEGVAFDREFVLLRGLIEIAQRRMQYASITDEKGAAIKVRKAGRREMALLLARPLRDGVVGVNDWHAVPCLGGRAPVSPAAAGI